MYAAAVQVVVIPKNLLATLRARVSNTSCIRKATHLPCTNYYIYDMAKTFLAVQFNVYQISYRTSCFSSIVEQVQHSFL